MPLTILGLGTGSPEDFTRRALYALGAADVVYTRIATSLPNALPLEAPLTPEALPVALLNEAAVRHVVYAVPGDPLTDDITVRWLLAAAASNPAEITVMPGISLASTALAAAGMGTAAGVSIYDSLSLVGRHHPPFPPDAPAVLTNFTSDLAADVRQVLHNQYPPEHSLTLVSGDDVQQVMLAHLNADSPAGVLMIPADGELGSFEALQEVIAHLRAPEGCPWDRKQTHKSLRPYLLEEAYEVLDALNRGDTDHLAEEMGDLMLQIVLHTQIAIEHGEFRMGDVMRHINEKMIRRHPHVWGDIHADDAETVVSNWQQIKQQEKAAKGEIVSGFESVLDGVPGSFTALMRAEAYAVKASQVGFDYDDLSGVIAKIHEELAELDAETEREKIEGEAGDVVFAVVDLLRWLGVNPEAALQATNDKFARRFRYVEERVYESGIPMNEHTLEQLDVYWQAAKKLDQP